MVLRLDGWFEVDGWFWVGTHLIIGPFAIFGCTINILVDPSSIHESRVDVKLGILGRIRGDVVAFLERSLNEIRPFFIGDEPFFPFDLGVRLISFPKRTSSLDTLEWEILRGKTVEPC